MHTQKQYMIQFDWILQECWKKDSKKKRGIFTQIKRNHTIAQCPPK